MELIQAVKSLPQDVAKICIGSKMIGQMHGRSKYTNMPLSSGNPQITNGLEDD